MNYTVLCLSKTLFIIVLVFIKRKRLFTGTVPINKIYPIGTVTVNKSYPTDTVPVNLNYPTGTVPVNKQERYLLQE